MTTYTTPRLWPWAAAIAATVTVCVLMPTADRHATQAHAAQSKASRQQATRTATAAQAVCESTHGPGAAHWWDGPVLVCAAEQRRAQMAAAGAKP